MSLLAQVQNFLIKKTQILTQLQRQERGIEISVSIYKVFGGFQL